MPRLTKGYTVALVGIAFWSTTGIFISYLIENYGMPALLLALWRNLLVSLAIGLALLLIRPSLLRIRRDQVKFYLIYGLILALFNSIWTLAVETNGAAVATVLGYSSAGFTAVLAHWLFKERLGLPKIVAVGMSLTGLVLVSNAYSPAMWRLNPLGIVTGLLLGLLFAVYNLAGKEAANRQINPWTAMFYSFAFGSVFILILNLIPTLPGAAGTVQALWPHLPAAGWLILTILSFIPTVLGYGLYITSMNYLPVSIASLLATSEPVMTAVEAYIFLGERMTAVQIGGSLIILSAVVVAQKGGD